MRLIGRLGQDLIAGAGSVYLDERGNFQFEMEGTTQDLRDLNQFRTLQRSNRYDGLWRFRLLAVDSEGEELHCGYTTESAFKATTEGKFIVKGEAEGLMLFAPSFEEVGTEILIKAPEAHWFNHVLDWSFPPPDDEDVSRYSMQVEHSTLDFEFDNSSRSLSISVTGSEFFPQTYTEAWLSEPLRMMTGHLAFPRIIVRANPDRTMIVISQIRGWHNEGDAYSLLDPSSAINNSQLFFTMYADLLQFVASARSENGGLNHEAHPLTKFYEELAQAMCGSRWIMTLTLASAIEGALDLLFPADAIDESANVKDINSLNAHIHKWKGLKTSAIDSVSLLKERAKRAVSNSTALTAIKRLKRLAAQGHITTKEVQAWDKVRNKVAHGRIFSPFSSRENDEIIMGLMSLFRKIAAQISLGRMPTQGLHMK